VFIRFLYELRARQVPVGVQEAVSLAAALARGLHESSLDGFYFTARALLVHSERHLDDFDLVFAEHFRGVPGAAAKLLDELLEWLEDPATRPELDAAERASIEALDLAELRRRFEQRLREQRERHDGGSHWIGTGGTSPFGRGGAHPSGLAVGAAGSGQRSGLASAGARLYRPYRSDVVLDVRQIEVALRKLRAFAREGAEPELDVDATIDRTARNAGELEIVTRPPRRANTRVILMMDVGGSMDPHALLVSQLFSAARRATHFRELRAYTFHNCVYGEVYETDAHQRAVSVATLLGECGKHYKLVLVGDASMASYELFGASYGSRAEERISGIAWLGALRQHFERSVWLNPDPPSAWSHYTVSAVREVFPMFPLTLDGVGDAVLELTRGRSR